MKLASLFSRPVSKLKSASPEIAIIAGVGLVVYGTVKACQATRKLDALLDEHKNAIEDIKAETTFPDEEKKEITKQYARTAWEMFRLYAPSVAIGGAGIFLIFKGHGILRRRYLAVVSAYSMLEKSYDVYRKRVINELGDAMDKHFRFGTTEEEVEVTETDKKGKEKTVKKKITTIDPNFEQYSAYSRVFDEFNPKWQSEPGLNKAFITYWQNHANDVLHARGYLFLNEVYEWLGFPKTIAGQKVGWRDSKNNSGDNFVDFGLMDVYKRAREGDEIASMWVNGIEPNVLLDFNCYLIIDDVFDAEI